jgi:hypothetical protein
MEHGGSYIGDSIQGGVVPMLLRDELCPSETVLRVATSRGEDRSIIDRNRYWLLCRRPQWGGIERVPKELSVLRITYLAVYRHQEGYNHTCEASMLPFTTLR